MSILFLQPYAGVTALDARYKRLAAWLYCAQMLVILLKIALAVGAGLLGAWALRSQLIELPERAFMRRALALQLVPALGLFVAFYIIGHQEPTSDVPGYYLPAARATLSGQVPVRDFPVSYAPLFSFVAAALVFAWNSGKVFALFAIVLNAVALIWWHSAASVYFERVTVRRCTILYATSGHVLTQALLGTNQAWVSAGLAASALLMSRDRSTSSGLAQAVVACTTKLLAHLFWPLLWICAPRRLHWLAGALLPTAAVYACFVGAGAGSGLLYPLRHEGELISPGNLPYLLDLVLGTTGSLERMICDGLTLTALAATTAWFYVRARALPSHNRQTLLLAGLALLGLVFMFFSKKSFTGYAVFVMYPVVLAAVSDAANLRARVVLLLVFNALLVAEPSLWFHLEGYRWSLQTWFAMGGGSKALAFVVVDLALLACYVYLGWLSARCVLRMAEGATPSRNSSQSVTACSLV